MEKAIVFKNIKKSYGSVQAVNGINLTIYQGEFFGLLGPNGAGKSTLINMLAGIVKSTSGTIKAMGFDVEKNYQEARHSLGIVPQELVFDPFFNVREMLRFQAGYFGKGRENYDWIDEILERLDLTEKAFTNMRQLSGGMKRRALIAQALAHRPPIIVLDEPTAGVDVELRQRLWAFMKDLNQSGHTIVLTTHYLEEAENLCKRIAMVNRGKLVALDDTKKLIRKNSAKNLNIKIDNLDEQKILKILKSFKVFIKNEILSISLENLEELNDIIVLLKKNKIKFFDIQTTEPDLEKVFLQMTKK
ncbi:MAG: ABC transporter ATP-binding protein [Proteobacteria bacterium]|nr:ABC transporter ATP-binding protein [Pseudomonadota bacterium]MDA0941463.1 ABC transporter ATP-binding protein [Pseudomonadota bacterium]MDA1034407.1 ABC transporter ATP-binding protein [Pseudomonadota bacterium]